jgi:predicted RNase H-like HicB family nuclease
MLRYMVVLERTADGYSAYAPDVPGCATTGSTIDETLSNMKEALELWVDATLENGGTIPDPLHVFSAFVDIDIPAHSPA